ncbi:MAG TPA: phosphoenolpyruvate--protein phosphotransferase [Kofleriaceae bacterium]|nr:phosphoenolpyruvate--protein phosphotransferase [Kofleriaceae bacterium]
MSAPEVTLLAPLSGPVVPIEEAPDPVFSQRLLGDGIAIEPVSETLLAPCDGTVIQLHRSGHALTVAAASGAEVLLHIGIDTVSLGGRGFRPHVAQGARVRAGDRLVSFDADKVARAAPSLQTMVVIANGDRHRIEWRATGAVEAGRSRLLVVRASGAAVAAARAEEGEERERTAVVGHGGGMHARPAALVREAARPFAARVTVRRGERSADARSVVKLMELGAAQGETVVVHGIGAEAAAAVDAVVAAIERVTAEDTAEAEPGPARAAPVAGRIGGVSASPGLAVGRVVRLDHDEIELPERGSGAEAERAHLAAAVAAVQEEIAHSIRAARTRGASKEVGIFEAHAALLDDPEVNAEVDAGIAGGESGGHSFRRVVRAQCAVLKATGSALLAERAADLRDLERRVVRALVGAAAPAPELFPASVLVAEDIGPSDLTRLPRERLVGLCTARGGATSHVAILARSLGLPALVALGARFEELQHGREVLLDADAGEVDPAPSAARVAQARTTIAARAAERARRAKAAAAPAETRDGHRVEVAANIATEADARDAVAHGADAVGLLRTELLFLERDTLPDVAEQRAAYQAVIDALGGRRAIIRTLDVGNDKELRCLPLDPEPNPALGLRGIRTSLARPEVLDSQLRALAAVRPASACRIMIPMVSDLGELRRVRARLEQLANGARLELGVMIEVPSAAILADQLATEADFLSIGTNDLTQYALAMDRTHPALAAMCDGLHPAVLRLVRDTVAGAARHRTWVGVCGALAGDLDAVPILVGLGVSELSVSPRAVPDVKARVRELDLAVCRREALALCEMTSAAAVRARAREVWPAEKA